MKPSLARLWISILLAVGLQLFCTNLGQGQGERYAPTPPSILTPDVVETRLGKLEFFDGFPSAETVEKVYDHLDFMRGVRAFLDTIPIASLYAVREGFRDVGCVDGTVGIFEELMDSKSLFLTANTESVYAMTWLDLKDGPVVVESPPNTLGLLDDFWFQYVTDLGNAGPDKGQGGKFLFLPPDYEGEEPDGYYTYRSSTFGNVLFWRGFLVEGDPQPAVANLKQHIRIYSLEQRESPPEQKFVNLSGREFNTIHANDFTFFDEVNQVVQEEPTETMDPELLGLLASIGIEKGQPFAPDARLKKILTDSARVGNATARAIVFSTRDPESFLFEGSAWKTGFIGGSHEFLRDGVRLLDARALFFYYATGITPAMAAKMVGVGSQYAGAAVDSKGRAVDGGKTYRLRFPPNVPAKDFWSLVLYDNQTRSMLQTDQRFPSLNSQRGVVQNKDGSTEVYFGPRAPAGKEKNWIQTAPGKGWSVVLRLYGPLESWFDKTWQPGEIVLMEDVSAARPVEAAYRMTTSIPASITTPDRVETRIGTLEFFDGFPTPETVELVYDNLDFMRGVEAFLTTIPAASIQAVREGWRDVGVTRNGVVVSTEGLMDAHSLYLTPNTESVYIMTWLDLHDGPIVVESPPNTLGMVNDSFFRYVADLGNAGPDRGQGGKYLFLPPDWEGEVPNGYFTFRSPTYGNGLFWRGFLVDGDPRPAVKAAREIIKIYPLDRPQDRERMKFLDVSGRAYNTIHANTIEFYDEVRRVVDEEPAEAFSPELLGLLAAIGIEKGKPFEPQGRMRKTLEEAAAVGNATARAISFRSRDRRAYYYYESAWFNPFVGGSHEFLRASGGRDLDARTMFHYPYTAVTPAMTIQMVGVGSQYAIAAVDADGNYLDGSTTYSVTLPQGIPAKDFWSFVLYDPQTRSLLQTPRTVFPSLSSQTGQVEMNADGSTTIWFGPEPPAGKESNWIQTVPGKGWFVILRLYGPLDSWFDKTWKPGEIELTPTAQESDLFENQVTEYLQKFPYQDTFDYAMRYTGGDPGKLNTWLVESKPALVRAGEDVIVRTNNDTYYKMAFLNLENGSVVLGSSAPAEDRFSSFQLMDDRNANYRNVIHPKDKYTLYFGEKPEQVQGKAIKVPSSFSVVIVRVEVKDKDDPEEVAAATTVFNGITIAGEPPSDFPSLDLLSAYPADVTDEANRRMDEAMATVSFTDTIVGPGQEPGRDVPVLNHSTGTKFGWGGPGPAHSAYESFFFDKNGDEMMGSNGTYTVTTEEPPVDAFWSITVYDTGRGGFLHPNDDDRYHINNTVAIRNDDGTVTFTFKQDCESSDVNCLEVPAGRFDLVIRYYLPHDEIITGEWTWPKIELQADQLK